MSAGKRRRSRGRSHRIKKGRPEGWGMQEPELEAKSRTVDITPRAKARPLGGHRLKGDSGLGSWGRPPGFRY